MELWRTPSAITPNETTFPAEQIAPPLLTQIYFALRRRRWIILAIVAAFIVLGLIATLLMTPQYTASTTIEIQREARNFTMVRGAEQAESGPEDSEFYRTQYGLLRSRSLAAIVASNLKLADDAAFFEMLGQGREKAWFANGALVPNAPARAERLRAAGDLLLNHIAVDQERLSRLVTVSFVSPDPGFSQKVVDAWAKAFIEQTLDRRYQATTYARHFLEGRLAQLRARIDQSERQLVEYASREGIVNIPEASDGDNGKTVERPLSADDLATLNRALSNATTARVQAESRLRGDDGATAEALENQAISQLRQQRATLAADYAKMMVQFEPGYPPAVAVRSQINALDRAIAREESRIGGSLRQTYDAAVAQENMLRTRVNSLKTGLLDLRRRSIQYNIYQRDVDTNRQLYDALLQRYKEIGVAGGVGVNNISVVDVAERPIKPSSPRLVINLMVALIGGLLVAAAVTYLLEHIDDIVNEPSEVEPVFGVPLLGTIPDVEGSPSLLLQDRKSPLSESYVSLQTNLSFSSDHGTPRTLAVTSSRAAEGKSTTSFALAQALARTGRRTLLIDGDMRSPSVHHMFDRVNAVGLSNLLSGQDDIAPAIQDSGAENLSIMLAGPTPPSAAELLAGDRFGGLLKQLSERFDHIVVDAPPVLGLADAPLIGSVVEGCVFVLESHSTKRAAARTAISRLAAASVPLVGIVLTKYLSSRSSQYYGYEYSYGSKNDRPGA